MLSLLIYRLKRLNRSVLARLSLLVPVFGALVPVRVPLMRLEYGSQGQSRTLIIFLPGIDDVAEDFERRGFIRELRREHISVDAVAVDAHYGYYAKKALFERITDDVITLAHRAGYERIWLAGISLGGFGAVSYAARHISRISGVILLAPYLGGKALIKEIAEAGGVMKWDPGHVSQNDFQRSLWAWFKNYLPVCKPALPIYIGYGTRDRFAEANMLLADLLPRERVFAIPGRHDWRTWKQIWRMFLVQWKKRHD